MSLMNSTRKLKRGPHSADAADGATPLPRIQFKETRAALNACLARFGDSGTWKRRRPVA